MDTSVASMRANPSGSASESRAYWRAVLAHSTAQPGLPADYPRAERFSAGRGCVEFAIHGQTFDQLQRVSGGGWFLLYTVLLAALKVSLRKHGAGPRIVVGSPPRRAELPAKPVSWPLPIVDTVNGSMTFAALLKQVRQTLLDTYLHQYENPFDVLEELGRENPQNRCALFDVALTLGQLHEPYSDWRNDITLCMNGAGTLLEGKALFRTALYRIETVQAFVERFLVTLESALAKIDGPISLIDGMSIEERQRSVVEWNQTDRVLPAETLHEWLSDRAAQFENLVAVRNADGTAAITFADLEERSNRLAHYLVDLGIAPDVLVPVCMRRSPAVLVALLGVMKAGGAYLPIDPDEPAARMEYMLQEAAPRVVVTERDVMTRLPASDFATVLLDEDWPRVAAGLEHRPARGARAESLAYVLYTSGSTGRPKGVMVTHRALVNYLNWCLRAYEFGGTGTVPLHGPLTSDMTVTSLFAPLLAGREIVILPEEQGLGPLVKALEQGAVFKLMKLSPAHLTGLSFGVSTDSQQNPAQTLVVGGEALRSDLVSIWLAHDSRVTIWNEYGPTETVVGSCAYRVSRELAASSMVPIGRPIDNTRIYLLDVDLQPVPIGVIGEICIGGAGVSRGYLKRPSQTAERFAPDPFSSTPGARLFRTGDLGKYRRDGTLEFLGRNDDQLKVRGYRVEPGEVESAILCHEAVQEAVVLRRDLGNGSQGLAAYLVARRAAPPLSELRRFLEQRLPDYMVPQSFLVVDRIPLLPNGKVDRLALPSPGAAAPERRSDASPLATEEERLLATVWSEVLGIQLPGRDDNFFELGGDSILSVQVVAMVRERGLQLQLNDIFEYPTLAELALQVRREAPVSKPESIVAESSPLLPLQTWFFEQRFPDLNHMNQSMLLRLTPHIDLQHIEEGLQALVERHDVLRTCFVEENGEWQRHRSGTLPITSLSSLDLSVLDDQTRKTVMASEATRCQASMNVSSGELMRAVHFDLGDGSGGHLLLAVHHLAVDLVSWLVLLQDLSMAVERIGLGHQWALPSVATSTEQWAEALRRHACSGAFDSDVAYWLSDEHRSVPPLVEYVQELSGELACFERELDEAATAAILDEPSVRPAAQVEEMLLAALAIAIQRGLGKTRFLVDVEHHGREPIGIDLDLSRTVGWLATLYPLLLEAPANAEPGAVLGGVRERVRRIPSRIGYAALRYLGPEATRAVLADMPTAEISLTYLGRLGTAPGRKGWFTLSDGPRGIERSARNRGPHVVSLDVVTVGGQLRMRWTWVDGAISRNTVLNLADHFTAALRAFRCQPAAGTSSRYQPSDFELVDLDQDTLDRIVRSTAKEA